MGLCSLLMVSNTLWHYYALCKDQIVGGLSIGRESVQHGRGQKCYSQLIKNSTIITADQWF